MALYQTMKKAIERLIREEKGQAMVERALIVAFFTILILATMKYIVDGLVSYYAYVSAIVCLPVP